MQQTSFTLLGFTQPHTAMPIIEDLQNNAKGLHLVYFGSSPSQYFVNSEILSWKMMNMMRLINSRKILLSSMYLTLSFTTFCLVEGDRGLGTRGNKGGSWPESRRRTRETQECKSADMFPRSVLLYQVPLPCDKYKTIVQSTCVHGSIIY